MPVKKIQDIPNAVRFNIPVHPGHEYYTDFKDFRGSFEENVVYKKLYFDNKTKKFDAGQFSPIKPFIYFVGMRGSGKTTELYKYQSVLENKDGFFTVFCSLDEDLDMNDLEYMDIIIFQLEKLIDKLKNEEINIIDDDVLKSMYGWFDERMKEINKSISKETGAELNVEANTKNPLLNLFNIVAKLKTGITSTKENTDIIRKTFRYKFNDFSLKFNEFIEHVNLAIRKAGKGQEVLFFIDGLEKTMTSQIREKIVIDEANRIKNIKAYTICTLPLELISERNKLMQQGFEFITFPFIKTEEPNGKKIEKAFDKFEEFITKRIDKQLFENESIIEKIIKYSGGSPREALRIIQQAWLFSGDEDKITLSNLNKGLEKLANEYALYLTKEHIEKLRELNQLNKQNKTTLFDDILQDMLEKNLIMEYNDGTYKKVNPVLTLSKIYKQYVED